jgi:DNA-directed RNA polymerase specialized sigma24 family protein
MQATIETDQATTIRQELFTGLYLSVFPGVAAFISHRNGTLADAQDIFQDALVAFYEQYTKPGFECHISHEAYLSGIAKNLWYRKFRFEKEQYILPLGDNDFIVADEPGINAHKVLQLLEQTGRKCLDLLHAFYYVELPLKHISKSFGYSSEHSASVQKYKCLEKIRDTIKENSVNYAHFID